ncbi:MAG: FmdB family transcriptional regulator [Actinomycetia bacterium]|nr:FmdB family transcriptional regulator [Actinomycetes bacterium]
MPTYAYVCTTCDHSFEAVQAITDDALSVCPSCSGVLRKKFHPVGVTFKGSGFYRTDSRSGSSGGDGESSNGSKDSGNGSKDSGASTPSTTKSGSDSSSGSGSSGSPGSSKSGSSKSGSSNSGSSSSSGASKSSKPDGS